ncbi:MAG: hypothetical protein AAF945_01580 [Actinomycetota bacterium]
MTRASVPPSDRRANVRVLRSLDDDWERLRRRPDALGRPARWVPDALREHRDRLDDLTARITDLDELRAASDERPRPHHGPTRRSKRPDVPAEEVLRWLIRAGRRDTLAARIVLQRVLPGVIHRCRPDLRTGLDERLESAVATAWMSIRTFDDRRRRGPAAATIISDATRLARQGPRSRTITELPRSAHLFDLDVLRPAENDSVVELARTIHSARSAGVPSTHLDLMCELVGDDGVEIVARRHGVSERTIRTRRRHAVTAVRRALGDGWCPVADAVA